MMEPTGIPDSYYLERKQVPATVGLTASSYFERIEFELAVRVVRSICISLSGTRSMDQ